MDAPASYNHSAPVQPPTADPATLKEAFGCLPSGVAAVCAAVDPHPTGMLVSSLAPVSLDPPMLSFCVQNGSRTWAALQAASHVGVSFLGDSHQNVCAQFALAAADRLVDVPVRRTDNGAVLVDAATAAFECFVHDEFRAGDHSIVVLQIAEFEATPDVAPLVFHGSRYRTLAV